MLPLVLTSVMLVEHITGRTIYPGLIGVLIGFLASLWDYLFFQSLYHHK